MKKTWWIIPVYCYISGFISFYLEVFLLSKFAVKTFEDGSIGSDPVKSTIISGAIFLVIVLLGGLLIFRHMTRKEMLYSASVLAGVNILLAIISYFGVLGIFTSQITNWTNFITSLLSYITQNSLINFIFAGLLAPYIFLLFGKKEN